MAILVLKNKIWDLRAEQHKAEEEESDTGESDTEESEDSVEEAPPKKDKDIWVEITGGMEHTIGRKAKVILVCDTMGVVHGSGLRQWSTAVVHGSDCRGPHPLYRRLKSNTQKYNYYVDSDNDTVIYE